MNFRQIECFLAVADCLSFSKAANRLFLAQSTVSQQVMSLEKELGFTLLERTRHSVSLTAAGAYLQKSWPGLVAEFAETTEHARQLAGDGAAFTLGYDGPLSETWIGEAVALLRKQAPDLTLRMRKESIARLTELLEANVVDAVVTNDTEVQLSGGEMRFHPLVQGNACVYFAKDHRFKQMRYVTPADLAGEHLLTAYSVPKLGKATKTGSLLMGHGIDFTHAELVEDGDTAFLAVQAGLGVFVASHLCDAFASRYDVLSVDLEAGLPPAVLGVAWKRDCPQVETLVRCAKHVLKGRRG